MAEKKAQGVARLAPVEVEAMGVRVKVRPDALDDYDVLNALNEAGVESLSGSMIYMRALLGDEFDRVVEELRDQDGRLPMSRLAEFVEKVQEQVPELKN